MFMHEPANLKIEKCGDLGWRGGERESEYATDALLCVCHYAN
jgi:hypothetical protein